MLFPKFARSDTLCSLQTREGEETGITSLCKHFIQIKEISAIRTGSSFGKANGKDPI